MSDLVSRTEGALPFGAGNGRRVPKDVVRRIDGVWYDTLVTGARLRGLAYITDEAMQQVVSVGLTEQSLGQMCPACVGRLRAIADAHAIASLSIVQDFGR